MNVDKKSNKFSDIAGSICKRLGPLFELVRDRNEVQISKDESRSNEESYLLPMAFLEENPMYHCEYLMYLH